MSASDWAMGCCGLGEGVDGVGNVGAGAAAGGIVGDCLVVAVVVVVVVVVGCRMYAEGIVGGDDGAGCGGDLGSEVISYVMLLSVLA